MSDDPNQDAIEHAAEFYEGLDYLQDGTDDCDACDDCRDSGCAFCCECDDQL